MKAPIDEIMGRLSKALKENSVSLALRKCKIHQRMHTELLKNPEYKALVSSYYQFQKSYVGIANEKIEREKKSC